MCEIVSTALTAAGLAMSAAGMVQQGVAGKQSADYNAQVARNEARVAQLQSDQSVQQAAKEQVKHDRMAALTLSKQRSMLAASGLDMSSGSAASQLADNAGHLEIDRQNIAYGGALNQWGYQNKANTINAQAGMLNEQGKNALWAGSYGAATSIVGNAGSIFSGLGSSLTPSSNIGKKKFRI